MPPEAIDLASRLLQYSPSLRCTAVSSIFSFSMFIFIVSCYLKKILCHVFWNPYELVSKSCFLFPLFLHWYLYEVIFVFMLQLEACAHCFFDELRDPNAHLPNGRPLPPLFNFKHEVCFSTVTLCRCAIRENVTTKLF